MWKWSTAVVDISSLFFLLLICVWFDLVCCIDTVSMQLAMGRKASWGLISSTHHPSFTLWISQNYTYTNWIHLWTLLVFPFTAADPPCPPSTVVRTSIDLYPFVWHVHASAGHQQDRAGVVTLFNRQRAQNPAKSNANRRSRCFQRHEWFPVTFCGIIQGDESLGGCVSVADQHLMEWMERAVQCCS